jgi:hypothetical protein
VVDNLLEIQPRDFGSWVGFISMISLFWGHNLRLGGGSECWLHYNEKRPANQLPLKCSMANKIIWLVRNKNSEQFARNPLLWVRPQTFLFHQNLRHVGSSEFRPWISITVVIGIFMNRKLNIIQKRKVIGERQGTGESF